MDRDKIIKTNRILNIAIAALVFLLFVSFSLPFFSYPGGNQETISIWGYLGFPENFTQIKALMDVKFLSIIELNVPLLLIVSGIVSILTCLLKKGIATMIFPLFFSVYGLVGYFISDFLALGNIAYSKYLQIAILAVTLVAVFINIVTYIREIKSRPQDYYLEAM